jgi:hypothetical protein
VKRTIDDLDPPPRRGVGCFGFGERRETGDLDKRIGRRLRSAQARQWRTYRKRLAEPKRRGVAATTARDMAMAGGRRTVL